MANYGSIKKDSLYNVNNKNIKSKLPQLKKDQLTAIPGLTKDNMFNLNTTKEGLMHLPYVNKDSLFDLNTAVLQRAKQLEYERFLRSGYTTNADWQKVLDNAKLQADYANPKQLNSYADVIANMVFGTEFENKGSVYKFLENLGLTWNGPLNVLGGIANLIDYTWQYNIKPITQGQWGIFGKNALMNFSETVDFFANPIKGALHEGGTGIAKSLGLTGDGRKNYDYDTGNKAVDMVLEIISDPGVWASFGGWAALKISARAGGEIVEEIAEAAAKSGVKELTENIGEEATKNWFKKSFKEAVHAVSTGKATDVTGITKIILDHSKRFTPEIAQQLSADAIQNIAEVILKNAKQYTESVGVTILRTVDNLDNTALKVSAWPIVGSYKLGKKIAKTVNSRTLRVLEPFLQEKEALSPLDYNKIMSKISEVNDSLVSVVEQQGLKSFDNTEVQKAFYKYTKEDINNLQRLLKKYSKGANVDFTAFKAELINSLVSKHGFDELLDKEIIPSLINKLALPASEETVSALKTFLKNPLDVDAVKAIGAFLPEGLSFNNIQKLIINEIPINKMLDQYADAIDNIAKQTALFENLKGSFDSIRRTYNNLRQTEDFMEAFAGSTVTTNVVHKAIDVLKKFKFAADFNLAQAVKDLNLDAEFDAFYIDEILRYLTNVNAHRKFTDIEIANLRKAIADVLVETGYIKSKQFIKLNLRPVATLANSSNKSIKQLLNNIYNKVDNTLVDTAYVKPMEFVKQYLLFDTTLENLSDESIKQLLNNIYNKADNVFFKDRIIDAIIKPVYNAFGLSNINAFRILINQELPKASVKKSALNLSEATAIFKQDVVKNLQEFYETVSYVVDDYLKVTTPTTAADDMLKKAYAVVQKNLQNNVDVFRTHYKSILDSNPTLKSNIQRFEDYGKELLSTNGTQKKITELVQNITKTVALPDVAEAAYDCAVEFKNSVVEILEELQKEISDDVIAMSEDSEIVFITDNLSSLLLEIDTLLKNATKIQNKKRVVAKAKFSIEQFKATLQQLDSAVKYQRQTVSERLSQELFEVTSAKNQSIVNKIVSVYDLPDSDFFNKRTVRERIKSKESVNATRQERIKKLLDSVPEGKAVDYLDYTAKTIYDKLETLINNAYETITIPERTFSLLGDIATYALKTEQTWNTLAYLSDKNIMDFVHSVMNKDGKLPQAFLEYADSNAVAFKIQNASTPEEAILYKLLGEAAADIQKGVDSILAYEQLLNVLEKNTDETLELRSAVLSTINSPHIARMAVDDIAKNREALFVRVFEGVENYINAQRKTGRYTLDAFRKSQATTGLFEKQLSVSSETWAEMAHHADADVITNKAYVKHELPDFKLRDNDIWYDIEATSLDPAQGEVLEVSLEINGTLVIFKRHLDPKNNMPGISNKILELYKHGEPDLKAVRDKFYAYYNKSYTGPQTANVVQYFDSEAELLQAVQAYIQKNGTIILDDTHTKIIKEDMRASRILGHNIDGYDTNFLKTRAEKTGVVTLQQTLDNFTHVDSYKLIQEKYGFKKLNHTEKEQIKTWLNDYITARTTYADTDVFSLYHAGEEFINAIPNELSVGLRHFLNGIDELEKLSRTNGAASAELKGFNSEVSSYFNAIFKELKQARMNHIKKPNMEYAKHLFTEDQLNTSHFKSVLRKILKQDPYYKKYTKEQLTEFVDYLNPSKAFYAGHEFINRVGFKKVFDPKVVRSWFDYVNAAGVSMTEVPEKLGRMMFNTAKKIERVASYVKNPKALSHFKNELDTFLNAVQTSNVLQRSELKNTALKYIRLNTDSIADKYSLVLYLRQILENNKMLSGQPLIKALPEDVVKLVDEVIDNHKLFTARTIRDTDLTFAEITKDIISDDFWTSAKFYAAKADDFAQNVETFNFVDDFDKLGIFSPEKHIMMHGAQKTGRLLSDFADWVADATTVQLFDAQAKLHYITENLNTQTLRNVLSYKTPEELLQRLVWNHGAVFNANEAWDIYTKLTQDAAALKEAGVFMHKEGDFVYLIPDRRVLDIRCELSTVDDITTKRVFVGKKGMPLQEVPMYKLQELDVDTAIELCRKEYTLNLADGTRAVKGAIDDKRLTQLGLNLKGAREGINTITNGAFTGVNADLMQKKTLRHIYENAPKEVQEAFGDIDALLDNRAWFSGTTFNLFNLGSTASKRVIQPGTPTHFLTGYKTTTEIALKNQETRLKFIDMVLNNDMRLDVGAWADTAKDHNIIQYLKEHPELTVAVLHKANNAKGYNIKRITINTVEDLHNARRLHASILTNQMYSRAASVVYSSVYDSGVLNAWSKLAKLYKIGQLSVFNFGALFRNFIDSTLKMFISTKDIAGTLEAGRQARKNLKGYDETLYGLMSTAQLDTEVIEHLAKVYGVSPADILKDIGYEVAWYKQNTIKDVINASVLYEKYNTALDEIIKMDSNAVLRPQNIEFYFNYMAKDFDAASFYEVHKFITQGSSAGHTTALRQVFAKDAGADLSKNIFEQIKETYDEQGLFDTIVHYSSKLGSTNAQLEQIIRLTQHMQQLRKGYNFAESNQIISKVHFDYADKTDITKSIELLFPYYNFKMKNFEYWADLIETQPWVARLFEDIMTPVWDFDSYDTYQEHLELANNESLTYQILAGNIPLNDEGLTLKLNPSITDAIQMVTDPFGNAQSSLWSPFNEGFKEAMLELWKANKTNEFVNNTFGLDEWTYEHQRTKKQKALYNLPLVGPTLQRQQESKPKYMDRINSTLLNAPSLFGAASRWNLENIKTPEEQQVRLNSLRNKYRTQQIQRRQKQYSGVKKTYKPSNRYYNAYNPSYKKYVTYYNRPYNRYKERSLIHSTQVSRPKRVYVDNIYWKYYTKSGKRRMDILNAKATRKNLQMKIKLMYDYYR
jgi:hypothetical protein